MAFGTKIVINTSAEVEYKKYRSTHEQIEQNRRDNQIQRQRDQEARNESIRQSSSSSSSGCNVDRRSGAA